MREYHINSNEAGQRFDKYLKKLLCNAPGSFVYKMLRKKNIVLNGKKADGTEKLSVGDEVKLFLSDETFLKFSGDSKASAEFSALKSMGDPKLPQEANVKTAHKLEVVYEDADVLIINKPSGMLSQKAAPSDVSANEYILSYLIEKGELTEEMLKTFRPSVCNRLDRNTSGLLVAGKTLKGLQEMSSALKERSVGKYYRCIVKGEVHEPSYIKGFLIKDERKNQVTVLKELPPSMKTGVKNSSAGKVEEKVLPIETEYHPLLVKNGYSELEVHLITGRSHQIRAHLASIGHPIVGDSKYGEEKVNKCFRKKAFVHSQLLHAYRMEFADGKIVTAPIGTEYQKALSYIEKM